jgi:hypothetical protein
MPARPSARRPDETCDQKGGKGREADPSEPHLVRAPDELDLPWIGREAGEAFHGGVRDYPERSAG